MADTIVIRNIRPYDGEYDMEFKEQPLNTLEWRWIKKLAGYLPGTFREGLEGSDPDLVCVLAAICMKRAGKIDKEDVPRAFDRLADAPFDGAAISIVAEPVTDDDADPPTETPETS